MLPLSWFEERRGKTINRVHKSNPQARPSYWVLADEKVIKYHYLLNKDNGYIYGERQSD
jgi:hypothetical protein